MEPEGERPGGGLRKAGLGEAWWRPEGERPGGILVEGEGERPGGGWLCFEGRDLEVRQPRGLLTQQAGLYIHHNLLMINPSRLGVFVLGL